MKKFVSQNKMSKKDRKQLNDSKRVKWERSPAIRIVESKKVYSRKNKNWFNDDM